jgi:phage terminase large subunit-like protein
MIDFASMTDEQAAKLYFDWDIWARSKQREPSGNWRIWLILAGRGFGKTRTGAEWIRAQVETGTCKRLALVGRTAADVRDVMVEGESGILAISPLRNRPHYEPSKRRLTWPNGARATTYSADEPDSLRGPQHDGFWADEPAAWQYEDAWDQLMFGLRLGKNPRGVATTTPRPTKLIKYLVAAPTTHVTRGSTYENKANLAGAFLEQIIAKYQGTRLGRQELEAEILEDVDGALWKRQPMIEDLRVSKHPELKRIVVGVDPSVTATEESAETGIIIVGVGLDDHGYVLQDRSLRASPNEWCKEAIAGYYVFKADRIVAEVNNGGDLVGTLLRNIDESVSYKAVRASRGKQTRAEPVSSLYERGLVHHVGTMPDLEDQMCSWVPGETSPDRMDALVWSLTELMVKDDEPSAEKHLAWLERYTELQQAAKEKAIHD